MKKNINTIQIHELSDLFTSHSSNRNVDNENQIENFQAKYLILTNSTNSLWVLVYKLLDHIELI